LYERGELKEVRDLLEYHATDPAVAKLVSDESSHWRDYLNFLEFVAYLATSKQLSSQDVRALFDYHLDGLRCHQA
jgi:hypothetical protein